MVEERRNIDCCDSFSGGNENLKFLQRVALSPDLNHIDCINDRLWLPFTHLGLLWYQRTRRFTPLNDTTAGLLLLDAHEVHLLAAAVAAKTTGRIAQARNMTIINVRCLPKSPRRPGAKKVHEIGPPTTAAAEAEAEPISWKGMCVSDVLSRPNTATVDAQSEMKPL
jgi:hypothetical protein